MNGNGNIKLISLWADRQLPPSEEFKIVYAVDVGEVRAVDSDGNQLFFAAASGDGNIYDNDGSLTGDRVLDGDGKSLTQNNLSGWSVEAAGDVSLLNSDQSIILSLTASNGARLFSQSTATITANGGNLSLNSSAILNIQAIGGVQLTTLPTYVDVATAQADGGLPVNSLYRITGGTATENAAIRIKI